MRIDTNENQICDKCEEDIHPDEPKILHGYSVESETTTQTVLKWVETYHVKCAPPKRI